MVSLQFEFKTLSKPGKFIKEITFNHVDSDLYTDLYSDLYLSIYSYIF